MSQDRNHLNHAILYLHEVPSLVPEAFITDGFPFNAQRCWGLLALSQRLGQIDYAAAGA